MKHTLKRISVDKGDIVKIGVRTNNFPIEEVYISEIGPRVIKGWKKHSLMICKLIAISGKIEFVLYNEITKNFESYILDSSTDEILYIQPGTWFAFRNLRDETSKIINFSSIIHSPEESENVSLDKIVYNWD